MPPCSSSCAVRLGLPCRQLINIPVRSAANGATAGRTFQNSQKFLSVCCAVLIGFCSSTGVGTKSVLSSLWRQLRVSQVGTEEFQWLPLAAHSRYVKASSITSFWTLRVNKASANRDPNKEQRIIVLLYTLKFDLRQRGRDKRGERESIFRTQKLDKQISGRQSKWTAGPVTVLY